MEERRVYQKPKLTYREYLRILKPTIFKVAIAFFAILIISTLVLIFDVGGISETLIQFLEGTFEDLSHLIQEDGTIDTTALIINNIRVCFIAFFLGVVPFLYLPGAILVINALVVGVLMGMVGSQGILAGLLVFALGIMPHGILELPAIFISIATGLKLCKSITKRNQNHIIKPKDAIKFGLLTVVIICVPLMIVAGIIETTITPMLLGM